MADLAEEVKKRGLLISKPRAFVFALPEIKFCRGRYELVACEPTKLALPRVLCLDPPVVLGGPENLRCQCKQTRCPHKDVLERLLRVDGLKAPNKTKHRKGESRLLLSRDESTNAEYWVVFGGRHWTTCGKGGEVWACQTCTQTTKPCPHVCQARDIPYERPLLDRLYKGAPKDEWEGVPGDTPAEPLPELRETRVCRRSECRPDHPHRITEFEFAPCGHEGKAVHVCITAWYLVDGLA